jgi:hypothetical protein
VSFPLDRPYGAQPDSGAIWHDYPACEDETQTPRRHPQDQARHHIIHTAKPAKRHIAASFARQKRLNPPSIFNGYSDETDFDE